MTKNTALLEANVQKYNVVKNLSANNIVELDKNDFVSGKFAWQVNEGMVLIF